MLTGRRCGGSGGDVDCPSSQDLAFESGRSNPASIRISVVLPQPEGTEQARRIRADKAIATRPSTAVTAPKRLRDAAKLHQRLRACGSFQGWKARRTLPGEALRMATCPDAVTCRTHYWPRLVTCPS